MTLVQYVSKYMEEFSEFILLQSRVWITFTSPAEYPALRSISSTLLVSVEDSAPQRMMHNSVNNNTGDSLAN